MVQLIGLPALQYPRNAELDFTPVTNALNQYRLASDKAEQWPLQRNALMMDNEMQRARIAQLPLEAEMNRQRLALQQQQLAHQRQLLPLQIEQTRAQTADIAARRALDERRVGFESDRLRIAQDAAARQEQEREAIRYGNIANRVRNIADPTERAREAARLIAGTPGLASRLAGSGFSGIDDPDRGVGMGEYDRALDHVISQVPDAAERYRSGGQVVSGSPGQQLYHVSPSERPGEAPRVAPLATVPQRAREMSPNELRALRDEGTRFSDIQRLGSTFDVRYAVPGVPGMLGAGDVRNRLARSGIGGDVAQAAAQWWQDYQRSIELIERNQMFGASLTPHEQAAWAAASITPNMAPSVIQRNLETRQRLTREAMGRMSQTLVRAGYDPGTVAEAFGTSAAGAMAAPRTEDAPPVPGARRAPDGKWYVPDPARPGQFLRVDP